MGFYLKAILWLGIIFLTQISQSKIPPLIPHIYVLGGLVNFWGIFGYVCIGNRTTSSAIRD